MANQQEILKEDQHLVVEGKGEIEVEVHVFDKISQREEIYVTDKQYGKIVLRMSRLRSKKILEIEEVSLFPLPLSVNGRGFMH